MPQTTRPPNAFAAYPSRPLPAPLLVIRSVLDVLSTLVESSVLSSTHVEEVFWIMVNGLGEMVRFAKDPYVGAPLLSGLISALCVIGSVDPGTYLERVPSVCWTRFPPSWSSWPPTGSLPGSPASISFSCRPSTSWYR